MTQCFEVPELGEVDAKKLFLYHAAEEGQFDSKEDNDIIDQCIARCYFRKSEKQGSHYLPLALKVLGMHLGFLGKDPSDWKEGLRKVKDFGHFPEGNPVFSVIRLNFDRLSVQEQALFMDVALYYPGRLQPIWRDVDLTEWLSLVHRQKLEETQRQMQCLKEKGLVEDVDIGSQRVSIHDLYREFAEMESQGKLNISAGFKSRRWGYCRSTYPNELEMTPSGGCWEKLIRVCFERKFMAEDAITSLRGVQGGYCCNVVVLKLSGLSRLKGVLNLKGLRCLRSLELHRIFKLDGVEGLEDLNSLTFFDWKGEFGRIDNAQLGQLPASLKVLQVDGGGVRLRRDVFARCTDLCKLKLYLIRADDGILDFSNCTFLRSVQLGESEQLCMLLGLSSSLHILRIFCCENLSYVQGLDHLVGFQHLLVIYNPELKKALDLQKLTNLQVLEIGHDRLEYWYVDRYIREVRGVDSLRQLRGLRCYKLDMTELPNLSGLQQLQDLELECCQKLTALEGVGGLRALRHLVLNGCERLLRLPDMSESTNLVELDLRSSRIELQEEDIQMLAKLPILRPVVMMGFSGGDGGKMDVVRRKAVVMGR